MSENTELRPQVGGELNWPGQSREVQNFPNSPKNLNPNQDTPRHGITSRITRRAIQAMLPALLAIGTIGGLGKLNENAEANMGESLLVSTATTIETSALTPTATIDVFALVRTTGERITNNPYAIVAAATQEDLAKNLTKIAIVARKGIIGPIHPADTSNPSHVYISRLTPDSRFGTFQRNSPQLDMRVYDIAIGQEENSKDVLVSGEEFPGAFSPTIAYLDLSTGELSPISGLPHEGRVRSSYVVEGRINGVKFGVGVIEAIQNGLVALNLDSKTSAPIQGFSDTIAGPVFFFRDTQELNKIKGIVRTANGAIKEIKIDFDTLSVESVRDIVRPSQVVGISNLVAGTDNQKLLGDYFLSSTLTLWFNGALVGRGRYDQIDNSIINYPNGVFPPSVGFTLRANQIDKLWGSRVWNGGSFTDLEGNNVGIFVNSVIPPVVFLRPEIPSLTAPHTEVFSDTVTHLLKFRTDPNGHFYALAVIQNQGMKVITNNSDGSPTNERPFSIGINEQLLNFVTATPTHTATSTLTPTFTATSTETGTPTPTPTGTPTFTPNPTSTEVFTPTLVPTKTPTPTHTAIPSPSSTETSTPTFTAAATSTVTFTPSPTFTATPTFTSTGTPNNAGDRFRLYLPKIARSAAGPTGW